MKRAGKNNDGGCLIPADERGLDRGGPLSGIEDAFEAVSGQSGWTGPFLLRTGGRLLSALRPLVFILAAIGWGAAGNAQAAIVNEPMTGATAPGWVIGGSAYLSASTGADPIGNGWLRLTEPLNDQGGFAFFNSPFDISQGVVISFDYATWGGNGADGYSVYLFDGSYDASTFSAGASGGSLGYAQKTVVPLDPGLTGGYIGIGIDEFGNFSSPTEGRIGGPGVQANEAGVRGPFDHPSGAYFWLGGSGVLAQQLAFNNQLYRPSQAGVQYRRVVINLTPLTAPNYLRVDVYVQFGLNQPLTAVVTGMNVGRPVPASVKIGYAASTGGSTNYHEIRNLVIDPLQTDIDLVMTKVASSPSVTQGGALTYTLTARNNGPYTSGTATNIPITDTIPALLTGATWTCASVNGGVCGAASGAGNLVTTATLTFNSGVSYTIKSTVSVTAPLGSVITNTATLTPPAGITDYNAGNNSASVSVSVTGPTVTVSGMVYNDNGAGGGTAHNGIRDGTEGSTAIAAIFAKLFRSSDLTTTLSVVAVNTAAGTYAFTNVPSYDNYTIILSSTNTANTYDPSFPNVQWIYTKPLNFALTNVAVAGVSLANQDFGVYQGTRFSGRVFKDDGYNGSPANANDGIQNAAESDLAGITMSICNNAACVAIDTTTTDASGNYALYIDWANAFTAGTARITQTVPAGYFMVNYSPGTATGTAVNIPGGYVSLTFNRGTSRSGILFGDVPDNTFLPTPLAQNALMGSTVYYGHTFTPGSGGTVSFSQASRTTAPAVPAWPAVVYYRDVNCNGTFDGSDTALPASITASAGSPICILVQDTVPAGALLATTDQIVTRATFTFTNSVGPIAQTYTVTDTTTVAAPGSVTLSGAVYNDANHNGLLDGGEGSPNQAGIYAKLFRSSSLVSAISITSVIQSSGTYTFIFVPPNDTYTIILSSTSTTSYDPSFPNVQWVYTSPVNYTLAGIAVGGTNLANQNFGVFNGTRIDGLILKDDGAATGANANNGVQNAGETGIAGQNVSICDNAGCVAIDTTATNASGNYSLFVPWATNFATARVTQTSMPAGYGMVNYNPGTAAGSAVNLASRYITFTFTRGTDVTGMVHSDVPDNTFTPTPLARSGAQTAQLDYAHTFTPGSGGLVSFSTPTRTQPSWPALVYFQDVNCNGAYDVGDIALPASISTVAGTPVCILVRDTVLATAPTGTTDQIVTRATFTFTNSSGPVVRTYDVTDTSTAVTPNLTTSTKTWTDLNGGTVNAGDILQYTITAVNSTATVTALGIAVTDNIPANVNSFTVVSIPALATDLSTTAGGTNGTGFLNVTGVTIPPSSSVTIVFNVSINGAAAAGTTINNTATITQPNGTVTSPAAPVATVVVVSGNKPLYLYSAPTYTLSRTQPGAQTSFTIVQGTTTTLTQGPALQGPVTITTPLTATLWIQRSSAGARIVNVNLVCSSIPAVVATGVYNGTPTNVAPGTQLNINLAGPATMSCPAGSRWLLGVNNASAAGLNIVVWVGPGSLSQVILPSQNVITVSSVISYIATYPSTTTPASGYFAAGQTVYVRAVVSDPFGSYDINANPPGTRPAVTIKDPTNAVVVNAAAMTQVADSGALTKTFEYVYTAPATGPSGVWSANVIAPEGTEGTVTDSGIGTFRVMVMPSITAIKAVQTFSDPYNNTINPKSIPGAVMLYTITLINSGLGPVDTDTTTVTDPIPANTSMCVSALCSNPPVIFTCSAAPACGLTYTYATAVTYTNQPGGVAPYSYSPVPDANGYDAAVTGFRVIPAGAFSGVGGPPYSQFTLQFRVTVK